MSLPRRTPAKLAAAALLCAVLSSCIAAAAGAAGGGLYYSTRGVEAVVEGSLSEVAQATEWAFLELSVDAEGGGDNGDTSDRREIHGTAGDDDVIVRLSKETATLTRVEVRVRTSAVTWDREMAARILDSIRDAA